MIKYLVLLSALLFLSATKATPWKGQWASSFGKIDFIEKQTGVKETALVFGNYAKMGLLLEWLLVMTCMVYFLIQN